MLSTLSRGPKHVTLWFVVLALGFIACSLVTRELRTASAAHVLNPPATAVGPTQSSPIALAPNNTTLLNVNPEANSVTVFDVTTDTPAKLAELSVGRDPSSVAILPDGSRAFVTNSFDGTASIINLSGPSVTGTFAVGAEPMAAAVSPNGTRLYVANSSSNNLMVFDTAPATPALIATVDLSPIGTAPRAIAVTNNGDANDTDETVFVAMFYAQLRPGKTATQEGEDDQREGRVAAISAATNTVLGTAVLAPMSKTFNGNLGTGFNSNGQLAPAPGQVPAVASTNPQAFTTPTGAFPNQLAAVAIQPGATRAYVVSTGASPNGPLRFNSMAQGLVSVFDTTTRAEITSGQLAPAVRQTAPLNMNQGVNLGTTPAPRLFLTNPVAMTWRPTGTDAWIAIQQADLIVRATVDANGIPTVSNPLVAGPSNLVRIDLQAVGGGQIAGKAPQGIAINSAGTRLYSFNFVSRSVSVINISNPTSPSIAGTGQASALPAPATQADIEHQGEELFFSGRGPQTRMSSEAWGSCATCHPRGRSDNVTWMFDAGPRQTISLDGTVNKFPPHDQRILNWSGVRDEVQDFELNTRQVFGGQGLIFDDRLFLAIGGANGAGPADSAVVTQFHQFSGAVGPNNDFTNTPLPALTTPRRDFAIATLPDDRVLIIGGRNGAGQGNLITGPDTVVEFNPRTNTFTPRSNAGFTPRHSLGAAAVRTNQGFRIYAIGGYNSTVATSPPVATVEEYNPATDTWRTVASLPTPTAQFGITVAGGINTAEPLQLVHVVSGNGGSEAAPSVIGGGSIVQRFQPDPVGPGSWSAFSVAGLTPRRNHGVATVLRGAQSRIFVIGGQDAGGTVLSSVEEYLGQAITVVATPHTSITSLSVNAPRARFGIGSTLSSNQIYLFGGVDGAGADQTTILEYTPSTQGPVAGPPGTPSGAWANRGNLPTALSGLQASTPPGVTNFLPVANTGRNTNQDAIAAFVATIRSAQPPVSPGDPSALAGRTLFNTVGLVIPGFSCASCHSAGKWSASTKDFNSPPSPEIGIGLGNERVIGAELRQTSTQPNTAGPVAPPQAPGVLVNVGTFTLGGGRTNEIRVNAADPGNAIAPLGANGFNVPSVLSVHETAPYFYSGLAQTLDQVFDGSQDGNGGVRHHFVANPAQRAQLIQYLRSLPQPTPTFAKAFGATTIGLGSTTSLTFTIGNPNPAAFTGVGFSDTLPAGLTVPDSTAPVCGGTLTTTNATGVISLAGATVAGNGQCQFGVTVTGTTPGAKNNTTAPLTSNETGPVGTASATVTVSSCAAPTITCPGSITKYTDPGQTTATVNPGTPNTAGGCNPKTVTGTRSDGQPLNAPYPKGTTLITWTVTDGSNLSASCTQTIVVMVPDGDRRRPAVNPDEAMLSLYQLVSYLAGVLL